MPKVFPGAIAILVVCFLPLLIVAGAMCAPLWNPVVSSAPYVPPPTDPFRLVGSSGDKLYANYCFSCHGGPQAGKGINIPPDLSYVGNKIYRDWLEAFIFNPKRPKLRWQSEGVRPATPMPAFTMTRKQAKRIADFLLDQKNIKLIPPAGIDWTKPATPEQIAEGKKLFAQYQCLGCHSLGGVGKQISPHLDGVASRLRPDFMYQWILDPQRIVPGTAMANQDLWGEEAEAIVRYLQTLKEPKK